MNIKSCFRYKIVRTNSSRHKLIELSFGEMRKDSKTFWVCFWEL